MQSIRRDLLYSGRNLRRNPGVAIIAIVTLALGIGASTAIFSIVENVLVEPFPYPDSQHFISVLIHDSDRNEPGGRGAYSGPEFLTLAEQNRVFDRVIGSADEDVLYRHGEGTDRFDGDLVTPGTFEFFGMPALIGRTMQNADYEPGAPPVFVLRYKTWVNEFNADPSILGKTFVLNDVPRTLIGIMPPRFAWANADVWIPAKPSPAKATAPNGFDQYWYLLGRLKPGVSQARVQADLLVITRQLATAYPKDYPKHFTVQTETLAEQVVGQFRTTLFIILAAVGLMLLIGCGNVANLLLARATKREREFAIRAALGAGRWRIVRQLLIESLILAIGGATLGALLAWGGLKSLIAIIPQEIIPAETTIRLNTTVLLFTLAVSALTALIFGLVPALQAARRDLNDALRDSGKGVGGARHGRLRNAVVVAEVAVSLMLLVGAGLLMRSFIALHEVHLGLQPDHILVVRLPLPKDRYKTAGQVAGFFRPLLVRLKNLPGVVDATETSTLPPYGGIESDVDVTGRTHTEKWTALFQLCSEGYFPTLKIRFANGRPFTEAEVNGARKLAVVNQTFAHNYLGGVTPIGQRVHIQGLETFPDAVHDPWFEIIGVVADVKNRGLQDSPLPEVWVPYTVTGSAERGILVRTAREPLGMLKAVQEQIWGTDPGVALTLTGTLEGYISQFSYAGPRFGFYLLGIFASIGLILVTIGVYSVLAYTTAQRTHEIGIRMALGAEAGDVLGLVIRGGLRLVIIGVLIGLAGSLALAKVMATQLWGVSPYDTATLVAVTVLLLGVGLLACWIPAQRAARVDPLVALRYE
jgi:predicted permease